MERNTMILGEGIYYSLDDYKTKVNNNVLVVGTAGAGKTRSIVTPNLLQATGSYIVTDPKGNLYHKYGKYLEKQGYSVRRLDFTDPAHSAHYNMFRYIENDQDIIKTACMLTARKKGARNIDPFWDEATQLLLQALISYLKNYCAPEMQCLKSILTLSRAAAEVNTDLETSKSTLDYIFADVKTREPDSSAVKWYDMFRVAANKTLRSILITMNAKLGLYDSRDLNEMTKTDDIDISSVGKTKTALFVIVSDTDRSMDGLVNLFFTQAMNVLCKYADRECEDNRLPVPVRFIMDDFATNCVIEDFPRMISSIRSRGISVMLMLQAESQLFSYYATDGSTIIGNCDTYVYLGGNDLETAKAVAERCNLPVLKILNMPIGTNWIFRRGESPINGKNFRLEPFLEEKGIKEHKIISKNDYVR